MMRHVPDDAIRHGEPPVDSGKSHPERSGQQFACEEGIDLNESFGDALPSLAQLAAMTAEMPKVESAYQPSGALPTTALLLMVLGSVVGCAVGAIAGAVIAGVGLALSAALCPGLLHQLGAHFAFILSFAIALGALLLAFLAAGFVPGWCIRQFGQWGKNRNIAAPVLLAILASMVPVIALLVCYLHIDSARLDKFLTDRQFRPFVDSPFVWLWLSRPFFLVSSFVGLLTAAATAGVVAAHGVMAAKFCENCQSFMGTRSKTVNFGCLRAFLRALQKGRIDVMESLLQGHSGWEGEVRLCSCPSCSRGYIEVTAKHKVYVPGVGYTPARESIVSWLTVSRELCASEIERIQPRLERG
jgi:hypothetical protein